MTEAAAGTVLGGKFVIEGVLGRGGMGIVYAARHRDLDQRVAIKCLLPDALEMPAVVERFSREARAAAKIQGEHVARVIDVGRLDDDTPYIVMEYLHGRDLAAELAARGPLGVTEAVRYVLETCEALAQAHAARIVHRDLKPSNLFLAETPGRRPIVKVLDFGISKIADAGGALTHSAAIMGTPYYMSPEQLLSSKSVDVRSDIWALGVILYELLVGHPPFFAETAPEIIAKIVQNSPSAPRSLRPDLPAALEAVILRCVRTRPEERYGNVAALAVALLPFADPPDRESAAAIARVLGLPDSLLHADVDPTAPTQTGPARPAGAPGVAAIASTAPVGAEAQRWAPAQTAPTVDASAHGPGTAANLALSAPEAVGPARRPGWMLPLVGGVALAGAAAVGMWLRAAPPAVSAAASAPAAAAVPAASPSPVVTLPPVQTSILPDAAALQAAPPPAVAVAPHATAVSAPAPDPRRQPSTAATPSAAPPAAHNPLDLQIK